MLNRTLRLGLRAGGAAELTPFRTQAWPLGLRPGIDPTKLNELADELEDQEILRKNADLPRRSGARSGG